MQSNQKNNITTKFFTRDYSKHLYKATYENYLSDEGITFFENTEQFNNHIMNLKAKKEKKLIIEKSLIGIEENITIYKNRI